MDLSTLSIKISFSKIGVVLSRQMKFPPSGVATDSTLCFDECERHFVVASLVWNAFARKLVATLTPPETEEEQRKCCKELIATKHWTHMSLVRPASAA